MLLIGEQKQRTCRGVTRRAFLEVGASTVLCLSLAEQLRVKSLAADGIQGSARSVILLWLWGGPAQKKLKLIDTSRHTILKAPQPPPLSAKTGFFGSRPFSVVNAALEASGGVSLDTIRDIASTGVNFVSVGALTHSARSLDVSLEVLP